MGSPAKGKKSPKSRNPGPYTAGGPLERSSFDFRGSLNPKDSAVPLKGPFKGILHPEKEPIGAPLLEGFRESPNIGALIIIT